MIDGIDHFVLTVESIDKTVDFYTSVLCMEHTVSKTGAHSLLFGVNKINLHATAAPIKPNAGAATPGSADFCLITLHDIDDILKRISEYNVGLELGPVTRNGALGEMTSVYFRDPDNNLVEVAKYNK